MKKRGEAFSKNMTIIMLRKHKNKFRIKIYNKSIKKFKESN
jgi:hypothetical protein